MGKFSRKLHDAPDKAAKASGGGHGLINIQINQQRYDLSGHGPQTFASQGPTTLSQLPGQVPFAPFSITSGDAGQTHPGQQPQQLLLQQAAQSGQIHQPQSQPVQFGSQEQFAYSGQQYPQHTVQHAAQGTLADQYQNQPGQLGSRERFAYSGQQLQQQLPQQASYGTLVGRPQEQLAQLGQREQLSYPLQTPGQYSDQPIPSGQREQLAQPAQIPGQYPALQMHGCQQPSQPGLYLSDTSAHSVGQYHQYGDVRSNAAICAAGQLASSGNSMPLLISPPETDAAVSEAGSDVSSHWGSTTLGRHSPNVRPFEAPRQSSLGSGGLIHNSGSLTGVLHGKLRHMIQVNRLQAFYPMTSLQLNHLDSLMDRVDLRSLSAKYNMPLELAIEMATVALYDIVILCDDSSGMAFEEGGARVNDLKVSLGRVAEVAAAFGSNGINVRFVNSSVDGNHVVNSMSTSHLVSQVQFSGANRLGTKLDEKVMRPFVVNQIQCHSLQKPVLVIVITGSQPSGEYPDTLSNVIKGVKGLATKSQYGPGAVGIEFSQVGRDQGAQQSLAMLGNDPEVGKMINVTSYYELEKEKYSRKGVMLTPDLWLTKLILGAVDPSFDEHT